MSMQPPPPRDDARDEDERVESNPFSGLSNRELIKVGLYYLRAWFFGLMPLASETDDGPQYFHFAERRWSRLVPGKRLRDEDGRKKVLIPAIPLIVFGRRVKHAAFLLGVFGLILIAVIIRLIFVVAGG